MRIAALDVGDATIGVAVSDELRMTAQGLGVVRRRGLVADIRALQELLATYDIERIVVGLPRSLNGTLGPQARKVIDFTEALRVRMGVEVVSWDERFSTAAVERTLLDANVRRKKRRQVIDKLAAVYILQGYLDSLA